ncbi:MAG: ATP-binding cassette domain-containing protein [Prevotellaceae bacterium]|jgi:ABC-2 type transport system ATP-binding protein|nr:ATP-binding cassette domain-containing protein [Prevotellaceae bacterium]
MRNVLTIDSVTKYYGRVRALNKVSLTIPAGCIYGILGPNGSGKTTLLGIIMDILKPTSGRYEFYEGETPNHQVRKRIGTLLETPNFYHYLSAERNLRIAAEIKGRGAEQIGEVLSKVNLYERRRSKFSTFSLGMKQRLAIASALLGDPDVLVFDEPVNGLDPEGIAEIRQLIKNLAGEGKTIIMASHLLDEVEKVCSHVAILKKGELLTAGKVDEVLANEDIVEVEARDIARLYEVMQGVNSTLRVYREDNSVILHFEQGAADTEAINKYCFDRNITLTSLILKNKSLESKFLEITK